MSERVIEFHLNEIAAWQAGGRASTGCPANGARYGERMLDAVKRHEQALIDLGHEPTLSYVRRHGFADGKRGCLTQA